jgi:uncharacterized protein YbjT (DUF2867 family)
MRVIIFGATGMVGGGALLECLEDARVSSVLVVGRSSCGMKHAKLEEVLHDNFLDFSSIQSRFAGRDACFYCLGVSAVGIGDEKYVRFTYDFTVAAAQAMVAVSPSMTFCFISAAGADTSGKSRLLWVRTKGRAESAVSALPFSAVYVFRPGFIRPMKGVRSKTTAYQIIYTITGPIIPLLQQWFPNSVTTTVNIGQALIELANPQSTKRGAKRRTLGNREINALAAN